ncbi:coiled-coil domain-containing protein 61 [Aplysia californica]|uniref:Centrosomal protein CCDC61 n=1 Tax=Aplysia californica TaxID=6500 RepID=A0ABM0K120_APLCA|nr:coiled-coil domain-containing protein 61 [Aplysia californica]XP_005106255.1 coiled-coil domain-containing protein 61 [Aplysia californica]XP_005106256.1 coiled-coil domain-containing protein 61 [Aplysia californica]XP_005106257.1 coiled-coil domain-containing protein 61 [Aplysia californica]
MEDSQDINVSCPYVIRGSDYFVSLECKGDESMTVQVEDRLSADQWRSTFDAQYIEDLTHKTGNFKQFNIFANMLESAISKASDSVILDLLTYSDLETLRHKKSGVSTSAKSSIPAPRSQHLTSKRYLILTYTVEFDRIHYPLPLPYVGKPDPRALQEEIRSLRSEIRCLKQRQPNGEVKMEKVLKDFRRLEREKHELEQEFAAFRREVRLTSGGSAVKDIRALKAMVRNLEDQLMKEKTRHQRSTNKRGQEYRDLLEEVEELRAAERNLRVRVKSLTNELAMYKRGRPQARTNSRDRVGSGDRLSASRQRSLSNDRLPTGRSGSSDRLTKTRQMSRERPPFVRRSNSTENISHSSLNNGSGIRARSNSFDRNLSVNRSRLSTGSGRSRTPSPAVSRKFNPTAYIKEKERKQKEINLKKRREQKSNLSGLSSRSKQSVNSSRHSAYSQRSSRENSIGSQGNMSDGYASDGSYTGRLRPPSGRGGEQRLGGSDLGDSPAGPRIKPRRLVNGKTINHLASTPDTGFGKTQARTRRQPRVADSGGEEDDSEGFDRSAEISEIDERLDRLQQLMKATMP